MNQSMIPSSSYFKGALKTLSSDCCESLMEGKKLTWMQEILLLFYSSMFYAFKFCFSHFICLLENGFNSMNILKR